MTDGSTAGLVLAAGSGSRFGQPKAPVVIDGERLVDRSVRCLHEGGCDRVVVVLGAWIGDVPGTEIVVNTDWSEGMGSSLRVGLSSLAADAGITRAVVTLVDLPGLTGAAVHRVVSASGDIVVATYTGERGHPVVFDRRHWEAVRAVALADEGARRFLRGRSDIIEVEVGDVANGRDLDTSER